MQDAVDWKNISELDSPESSPGFLLWKVSIIWRRQIEQSLKKFGLTHPQFVVLANLAWLTKNGHKVSQIDIAQQTNIDVATTSQIIRYLERKKLIRRKHIKGDERAKYPYLTKEGRKIINGSIPEVEKVDQDFFAPLKKGNTNFITKLVKLVRG